MQSRNSFARAGAQVDLCAEAWAGARARRGGNRRVIKPLGGLALALFALAACTSGDLGLRQTPRLAENVAPATPTANPNGEVVGQGQVRLALLIPKSAPGNAATVATEIRNGAVLAMQDFGSADLQLVIKDTAGQAAGAQAAAGEAVREGSTAVLGPVFAGNVTAASAITQPAGRTLIAFSTDTSTARRGVYLLSYTPQEDTSRIIRFGISRGAKSILAFLPNNTEGGIREAVLRQEAGAGGASVQVVRYDRSVPSIETAVATATPMLEGVDAVYIPEGSEIPNVFMQVMRRNTVNLIGKLIMGSGSWESTSFTEPQLEGALFPGRDTTKFADFASRYETAFGAKPTVWAALGYDSITLSTDLVRRLGPIDAFKPQSLENPSGYAGVNGIFRLKSDGTAERGLAIYQVERNGAKRMVSPAPSRFGRTSSLN